MNFLNKLFKKKNSIKVLMYHRIADAEHDPWGLSVSPCNFEAHLKSLKKHHVISLDEMFKSLLKGKNFRNDTIAVTFDDAYLDNYEVAKPLLEKYQIPATFFVTTGAIFSDQEYWWDALERIILSDDINLQDLIKHLSTLNVNINEKEPTRLAIYYECCKVMQGLNHHEQRNFLKDLIEFSGNKKPRKAYLTMNLEQLKDASRSSYITIGAHTVNHPFLPHFSLAYQEKEIKESIAFLENELSHSIDYFAYPHGGCNADTIEVMKNMNIKLTFTTEARKFYPNESWLHVPRFQVANQPVLNL